MLVTMETDRGEIVSTEVHMNAGFSYHVHAELVGRRGAVALPAPACVLSNCDGAQGFGFPDNWVPRFADSYRIQMQVWVDGMTGGGRIPLATTAVPALSG